jgi:hypothetical protein
MSINSAVNLSTWTKVYGGISPGARLTIKVDRLIVSSKSRLLVLFLEVSLIVIIKGRSQMVISLIVIIKEVPTRLHRDFTVSEVGFQQIKRVKKLAFEGNSSSVIMTISRKRGGEDGSGTQKRGPATSSPDTVGTYKKTSTTNTSDRRTKTKTTNLNLVQGTKVDALRTVTSYFDKDWNVFA